MEKRFLWDFWHSHYRIYGTSGSPTTEFTEYHMGFLALPLPKAISQPREAPTSGRQFARPKSSPSPRIHESREAAQYLVAKFPFFKIIWKRARQRNLPGQRPFVPKIKKLIRETQLHNHQLAHPGFTRLPASRASRGPQWLRNWLGSI